MSLSRRQFVAGAVAAALLTGANIPEAGAAVLRCRKVVPTKGGLYTPNAAPLRSRWAPPASA